MPKWSKLPADKIYHQPNQMEFLAARRLRYCAVCKADYVASVEEPFDKCPTCMVKGQRLYHFLTIIAGRRFGKSLFGSIAGTEEACIPDTIGWACAPTNPKLHRYVIPAFQKLIPNEWVESWSSEFNDLRLKNGSLIHFQTLEDPDQGRGQGLDWLWIDEVCELTLKHWDVIRPSLGDKQGVAFFTTSPRSYDWVYEKLYKPAEDGVIVQLDGREFEASGYWGLHAKTSDNPLFHTSQGKAFLDKEKASMSDEMYRQEYEADFVNFTGSVYGEYLKPIHILRSDAEVRKLIPEWPSIDPSRPIIVGIDTGADHPFGGVKLVSTESGLVVVGDYLERNSAFTEHATALKRLASSSNVKWAINKNEKQGMIELAQHGIFCQLAQNDQMAGIERVKSWLHANQLWFVESHCPRTVKQMKAYRFDENYSPKDGAARKERVFKKDDELPDCLRYAVMTWPLLPQIVTPVAPTRDISGLPQEMQDTIRRIRRIENPPKELDWRDMTGDMWS